MAPALCAWCRIRRSAKYAECKEKHMPQSGETKGGGMIFWVAPNLAGSRELVETTARGFKLTVRFCAYGEVIDQLRTAPCELIGIELDANPAQGLALIKELHQRFSHLTILAASGDA